MEQILADFEEKLKGQTTLLQFELVLVKELSVLFSLVITALLERLDLRLYQQLSGAQVLRRDSRTLNGLLGSITFKRRLVQRPDGTQGYLLDEYLKIPSRRRYSPALTSIVAALASKSPYRVIEAAVNALTPVTISHSAVGTMVKQVGHDIEKTRRMEAQKVDQTVELKQLPVLYLEGDAFEVKLKKGRTMVHRFQVFEGVAYHGKRHSLINRYEVTNRNRQVAIEEMMTYLRNRYDLHNTLVITSSDNGSGYEACVFSELALGAQRQIHLLDQYHMNRKLKERLPDQPKLVSKLQSALYHGNWHLVEVCLDTAESLVVSDELEEYQEKLAAIHQLRGYLKRNWANIKPFSDPDLNGQLAGIGSCESNHRRYTYRLKHQGKSWGKSGLDAMLRIIDAQQNDNYRQSLIKAGYIDLTPIKAVPSVTRSVLREVKSEHLGITSGRIYVDAATSSAGGHLAKIFR